MGLFWSLDGKGVLQPPIGGAIETTIDVLDESGRTLASSKIQRRIIPADVKMTELRQPPLDHPVDPATVIPVERIRAPIFLASAGDDFAWPSLRMARDVRKRLADHHFKYLVELHEYRTAGHGISPPGFRAGPGLGGTAAENARAGADAWAHLIMFLDANLGSKSAAH